MKILAVSIAALVCGIASWYCFYRVNWMLGIPVRSIVQLGDMAPGNDVTAYGSVYTGVRESLSVYTRQVHECDDDDDCSWNEVNRHTPPFHLLVADEQRGGGTALRIVNDRYVLSGPVRLEQQIGTDERLVGFRDGDLVLVIGKAGQDGITADEVYGGTREAYMGGLHVYGWLLACATVLLAAVLVALVITKDFD